MVNLFVEAEDNVLFDDDVMFDEEKILNFVFDFIMGKLNDKSEMERRFFFEDIICDFFDYIGLELVRTGKTRDFGLDGIVGVKLDLFGELNLGLQIKYKLIDSNDVDLFLSALRNAELRLGVMVCKDSRNLNKYTLDSKIKAILLSKGIKIREKMIKERIDINPVFVLKLDDIFDIVASRMRGIVMSIYKK